MNNTLLANKPYSYELYHNIKELYHNIKWRLFCAITFITAIMPFMLNPIRAAANTEIDPNTIEVTEDGSVRIDTGNASDADQLVANTFTELAKWVGFIAGFLGLGLLLWGLWSWYKGSQEVTKGNSSGWQLTGYALVGSIVGGIGLTIIGFLVGIGASTGSGFFN